MQKYKLLLLILLGSFTWVLTMFKSGQEYGYGIGFWGPHGHDAVWHLSLINSLSQNNFDLPMFAGVKLKNYHFGFDVMTALLVKLTHISSATYYFQILPILFSLTIGFLVYYLTRNIWAVYLTYFATGLGWIFGGESTFWAQQALSTLINPPYALSLIFLLLGFIYLKKKNYLLTAIFFGTVGFIKIYAGILGIFTLLFFAPITYILISILLSLFLFLPFNNLNNKTLIWSPFWFVLNLFSDPTRLYWPKLSSAITNYYLAGNLIKLIPSSLLALSIFIIGNLGLRIVGFIKPQKLFLPLILLGLIFPIFFVQSGTTWNTIQFMYYSMFFLCLCIKPKTTLLLLIILLLTLPAIPQTLQHYLPQRPPTAIPKTEIEALNILKILPSGTVLVPLYDKANFSKFTEPRPLFAYESTAYVSAYSTHPVFLEDEVNLNILNINIDERKKIISEIFSSSDPAQISSLITQNQVKYIYLPNTNISKPKINPSDFGFTQILSSGNTQLWTR